MTVQPKFLNADWYASSKFGRVLARLGILAVLVIGIYLLGQLTQEWSWQQRLLPLKGFLFAFIYVLPAWCCSYYLSRRSKKSLALCLVAGFVMLAAANYCLALLGLLRARYVIAIWVLFWIPEVRGGFEFCRYLAGFLWDTVSSYSGRAFAVVGFVLMYATWASTSGLGALYPATSCDVSLVHLILPKIYLHNHGLVDAWWTRGPFLPQMTHSLFWGVLSVGTRLFEPVNILPAFINSIACCVLALVLAESVGLPKSWPSALSLLLLVPVMRWVTSVAYLDVFNPLLVTSVGLAALLYACQPSIRGAALLGFLGSACLCNKHMGLMFIVPIGLLLGLVLLVRVYKREIKLLEGVIYPGLAAVASGIPFFILFFHRNFLLTGNPLFPFGKASSDNGYFWDQASIEGFRSAVSHWTKDSSFLGLFAAFGKLATDFNAYSDTYAHPIGSLLCVFIIIGAVSLCRRYIWSSTNIRPRHVLAIVLVFWAQFSLWYFSSPVIRYLLPSVAIAVALMLPVIHSAYLPYRFAALIFVLVSAWHSNVLPIFAPALKPPVDQESTLDFLSRQVLSFPQVKWLYQNTSPSTVVYSYFDSCNMLYYSRPVIGDWFGSANYGELVANKPISVVQVMRKYGVEYVLENHGQNFYPKFDQLISGQDQCFEEVSVARSEYARLYRFRKEQQSCAPDIEVDPKVADLQAKSPARLLPFELPKGL